MIIPWHKGNFIILYAILLQTITGFFVLFSAAPINVAQLGVFYKLFPSPQIGAALMLISVALAISGIFRMDRNRFLYFVPQHLFLLLTAGSAVNQIFQEHYADGTIRSWQFILIDQLPSLLTALLYTIAIYDFRKKENYAEKADD